jgi:hypothetical protein
MTKLNKTELEYFSNKIKHYLGEPIVSVELTTEQLYSCIDSAIALFNAKHNFIKRFFMSKSKVYTFIFNSALSSACRNLALIRGKFNNIPTSNDNIIKLNSKMLMEMGDIISKSLYNNINNGN